MTAQIADPCFLRGRRYNLVGTSGGPLFEPKDHGMIALPMSSARWCGYRATYVIADGAIVLRDLEITVLSGEPVLNGMAPRTSDGDLHYAGVNLPLAYTGGVLLGDGFIKELGRRIGHPACKYRRVIEVVLEAGRVAKERDVSAEIAEIRARLSQPQKVRDVDMDEVRRWAERIKAERNGAAEPAEIPQQPKSPDVEDDEEQRRWIERRFSLDYGFWVPRR